MIKIEFRAGLRVVEFVAAVLLMAPFVSAGTVGVAPVPVGAVSGNDGSSGGSGGAAGMMVVDGDTMRRQLVTMVSPKSTPEGTYGTVVLDIVVDCNGKVASNTVRSGPTALTSAVMTAVNQWVYKPYVVNGVPVEVQTTVTMIYGPGKK